jgi:Uracil DNA glycosylase superfamily
MNIEFDKGPSKAMATLFSQHPDYSAVKDLFWFDWGPIFYRGRLDKTAKLLCVASDPGPTERIAGRALIGNAGQRLQGFLSKTGITKSYVCLNGFVYSLHPSHLSDGIKLLSDPAHLSWRNKVFKAVKGSGLQAIVAFGVVAQAAVDLWDGKGDIPVFNTFHPSYSGDIIKFLTDWNRVITGLRQIVTKDSDGDNTLPLYGNAFLESDYASIPRRDLPFGAPEFLGDDAWRRKKKGMNTVSRSATDDHVLTWIAPQS